MTDNEIIKALKICNSLHLRCGNGCPYYEVPYKDGKRCSEMMINDALDLINRQKAEIKQKDTEIDILIRKKKTLRDEISELETEIEQLEAGCEKQYEIAEANIRAEIADGGTSCHWCTDKNKTQAYKEFAERLKGSVFFIRDEDGWDYSVVFADEIDNLVKELTEGNGNA